MSPDSGDTATDTVTAHNVTKEDVLTVLNERNEPILSTSEIQERIEAKGYEMSRPTLLRRLEDLHDANEIEKKEIGTVTVWWVAGDEVIRNGQEIMTADGGQPLEDNSPSPTTLNEKIAGLSFYFIIAGGTGLTVSIILDYLGISPSVVNTILGSSTLAVIIPAPIFLLTFGIYTLRQRQTAQNLREKLSEIETRRISK